MARPGEARGPRFFRTGARLNLLDEDFPEDQALRLKEYRIPFRQIGREVARLGIGDSEIVPLLHRCRRVTFLTLDRDFFQRRLCHPAYCLVWLDARADDTSHFVRQFLRHPNFENQQQRLGIVARAPADGIHFWRQGFGALQRVAWTAPR